MFIENLSYSSENVIFDGGVWRIIKIQFESLEIWQNAFEISKNIGEDDELCPTKWLQVVISRMGLGFRRVGSFWFSGGWLHGIAAHRQWLRGS